MDFEQILARADASKSEMFSFLRDIVAIESFDGNEGAVIQRIRQEMEKVGFDHIEIDPMGNLLGYLGHGEHLIAMDAHIDTVTYGDKSNWTFDPFLGMENEELIGGLGATDQKGGMASMIYAAKIIRDLQLEDDYTLLVTGTVMEENGDGLCWQYIIEQDGVRPEFALLTEPSDGCIRQGQRGRMEIMVRTQGVSCHGSTPHLGSNAVYRMAPVIAAVEQLNDQMTDDGILGKGSITISEISSTSPSRCAVADSCSISLDRRLNALETPEFALAQLRSLPEIEQAKASVDLYLFEQPSYTGLIYPSEKYYPSWIIHESEPACQSVITAYRSLFNEEPVVCPWQFSTNGVAIMGRHQIPCVGFGPGRVQYAHCPNEITYKNDLVRCCAMYASIPSLYLAHLSKVLQRVE